MAVPTVPHSLLSPYSNLKKSLIWMKVMRSDLIRVGLGLLITLGCASTPVPESSPTGTVFEVKIGEPIPRVITVKERDEVRWSNTTTSQAHISLTKPENALLSCLKGFTSEGVNFVGSPNPNSILNATVNSHESASLCFSNSGIYDYTVREQGTELAGTVMVK